MTNNFYLNYSQLKPDKKMIIAAVIGNVLEYVDFITFIFLAPIISKLFFPSNIHELGITFTYLTIIITYLCRPIGGMILGVLGDTFGRKSVFSTTLLLMAIPSFIISILPTFPQIGYISPIILLLMRIIQGCSIGGEVPGSITYIAEKFHKQNYFFYCAMLTCGANIGVALSGQFVSILTQHTSINFMYSLGWRILFLSGSLLAFIGVYIRLFISESEEFTNFKKTQKISYSPLLILIKSYTPQIASGILMCMVVSLITSVFQIFLPGLLTTHYFYSLSITANLSSIGAITMAIFSLIFAYLTKFIHPLKIIQFSVLSLIILLGTLLLLNINLDYIINEKISGFYSVIIIMSIFLAGINGLFFGLLADLFPVNIRYSGISICYNTAYIFGAGLTPFWANYLLQIDHTGYKYIVAICFIFILLFSSMFKPKISNMHLS